MLSVNRYLREEVVASKLHADEGHVGADAPVRQAHQPPAAMATDLRSRFFAVFLALLSVAAIAFAWINFQKEREFVAPYDGIWWVEDAGHLRAERVDTDGPGQKAGIKKGDLLVALDGRDITDVGSLERQLYRVGVWSKATYSVERHGVSLEAPVILVPADRTLYGGLRLIALVYLGIGLYVLLRRWTARLPTSTRLWILISPITSGRRRRWPPRIARWMTPWTR